ncbi:MAG: Panacea domain-containing protein [Bacilli bacterium]
MLSEEYNPTEYNGYTKFNKEKVYNMIIYFADNTILKTKLLKEMFYADFLFYKENCKSITGLEYCKLPFGPVPDGFEVILSKGYQEDIIDYESVITPSKEYYEITSKKKFNKDLFTKEELEVLDKIKKYFKNYNAKEIVEYSHKEKAFIDTNKCEKISYDYSFDIDLK